MRVQEIKFGDTPVDLKAFIDMLDSEDFTYHDSTSFLIAENTCTEVEVVDASVVGSNEIYIKRQGERFYLITPNTDGLKHIYLPSKILEVLKPEPEPKVVGEGEVITIEDSDGKVTKIPVPEDSMIISQDEETGDVSIAVTLQKGDTITITEPQELYPDWSRQIADQEIEYNHPGDGSRVTESLREFIDWESLAEDKFTVSQNRKYCIYDFTDSDILDVTGSISAGEIGIVSTDGKHELHVPTRGLEMRKWYRVLAGNRVIGSFSVNVPLERNIEKMHEVITKTMIGMATATGLMVRKGVKLRYEGTTEEQGKRTAMPTEDRVEALEKLVQGMIQFLDGAVANTWDLAGFSRKFRGIAIECGFPNLRSKVEGETNNVKG